MKGKPIIWIAISTAFVILLSCGSDEPAEQPTTNQGEQEFSIFTPDEEPGENGIGPITELELGEFDQVMSDKGAEVFDQLCVACHKLEKRHVGPALGGVLERRNPAWVMNMILNPEEMVEKDPVAKALFAEYLSPMANQNLTEEQARQVVEYIRSYVPEQASN